LGLYLMFVRNYGITISQFFPQQAETPTDLFEIFFKIFASKT
jgi:hypothetical protein